MHSERISEGNYGPDALKVRCARWEVHLYPLPDTALTIGSLLLILGHQEGDIIEFNADEKPEWVRRSER